VKSSINFFNESVKFALRDKTLIRGWIERAAKKEGYSIDSLSYIFCNDKFLLELNKKYLHHDTLTDIITFDYSQKKEISGEIFISVERVKENAKEFSVSQRDELHRVIIHGVLHLCGYQDKTSVQQKRIKSKENYYLSLRRF